MSFTGNEGTTISLQQGAAMTRKYCNSTTESRQAVFYGINRLNEILSQQGCVGIRIYLARDGADNMQLVLVGADANEQDMLSGVILDQGLGCPENCSADNPLNSDQ